MDEDLLSARYVFRKPQRAETRPDGTPVWGESLAIPLDPLFTAAEVAELRSAVLRRPKAPPVQWNCYTLSGRISSPCGKHYVGGSPAGEKSPHYVCRGKRAPYAGASTCSCPQIYATGVENWAWTKICGLLGEGEQLRALVGDGVGLTAPEGLTDLAREQQREFMTLLDVRIKIAGPPPPMRRGLVCPVAGWFRKEARSVPTMTDEVWSRLIALGLFPNEGTTPRQKGGLAPRTVLEAFLEKARTDARWAELDAKHCSTGLRGHWRRWTDSGLWAALMNALEGCQGTPPTEAHPLPTMEMTARVGPGGQLIAVADHVQAWGPSAAACCS